ncbi:cysteine--tRNA ligase [Candidatus Daviesbacteria bacterium]|nr:cysteine--tRNA ligase [Candidatus Daviesbacteria bacterium]
MKIYNSLTNKLEEFKPLKPDKITIYICGITPYDTTHLGHAFTYISFDVLIRYLRFKGYQVIYTQNVTDINDRDKDILEKAKQQKIPWNRLADYWTEKFLEDMRALNWTFPDHYLKASEQIPSMIRLIRKLIKNSLAYQIKGSVYLDISEIKDFGKLSKLTKDQMLKVAKDFEEDLDNPEKKNPLDITLWRGSTPSQASHIPSFNSPFGKGRPGWHIECSAMSMSTFGETIDIHGGGSDLIFPHHEAEIAQSEAATGKIPFVKYWMHTGTVSYKGAKMSKSKENLVMVSDLLKKYSANALRFLLLSNHWRNNWEYKEEDLQKAQKNVELIESVIAASEAESDSAKRPESEDIPKAFTEIMDQDLDTPKALEFLSKFPSARMFDILGFRLEK